MANELIPASSEGQLLIYEDGSLRVQVRIDGKTVWLTQRLIAELYQVTVPTVNEHLKGIYGEGELETAATIRKFRIVQTEGVRKIARMVEHYNLDAILAVGYRVRSPRGTAFRKWATARLSELLVKGFTMDDDRLAAGRTLGDNYFDELLERIRAPHYRGDRGGTGGSGEEKVSAEEQKQKERRWGMSAVREQIEKAGKPDQVRWVNLVCLCACARSQEVFGYGGCVERNYFRRNSNSSAWF